MENEKTMNPETVDETVNNEPEVETIEAASAEEAADAIVRAIIGKLPSQERPMISIPVSLYSSLIADSEKLDAIVRFVKSTQFIDKNTILAIADELEEEGN